MKEERTAETPAQALIEGMFDDLICEDIEDQNSEIGGSDNMSAILIEFKANASPASEWQANMQIKSDRPRHFLVPTYYTFLLLYGVKITYIQTDAIYLHLCVQFSLLASNMQM